MFKQLLHKPLQVRESLLRRKPSLQLHVKEVRSSLSWHKSSQAPLAHQSITDLGWKQRQFRLIFSFKFKQTLVGLMCLEL